MNQILETNLNNDKTKLIKSKKILAFQFYFSVFFSIFIISFIIFNIIHLYKQEKYSSQILNNYNITKLYSNLYLNTEFNSKESINNTYIIGTIEISKINIYYPIFSNCTDELLKISPCKFYGTEPGNAR